MNAQEKWKKQYRYISHCKKSGFFYEARKHRIMASDYRREAALERALAAANRRIEAQAQRIEELEADLEEYQIQEYQVVFPLG